MKEQSLVDLFELYDQAFDQVCNEFGVKHIPTWRHRWMYRFFQINFVPHYIEIIEKLLEEGKEIPDGVLSELYLDKIEYQELLRITKKYYSPFYESFPFWWFSRGKNYFSQNQEEVELFMHIEEGVSYQDKGLILWLYQFFDKLKKICAMPFRNDYLILSVPLKGSKKDTLELVKDFFDKNNILFSNKTGAYEESKTKMPLRSIKDAYRLLEFKAFNHTDNLIDMAKGAGVLKVSAAGLDSDFGSDSTNSIRAGTVRLNNFALDLLSGLCIDVFPANFERGFDDGTTNRKIIDNYFESNPSLLFDQVRANLPQPSMMLSKIRDEMTMLSKSNLL
jgi:hypothetical protein